MPCFSASNVRFTSAAEQLQQKCKDLKREQNRNERAKSAVGFLSQAKRNGGPGITHIPFQRQCEQIVGFDTKVLRRALVQRKKDMKPKDLILMPKELKRLKECSKVASVEDRIEELKRQEDINSRMSEEAEHLRLYFKKMDDERNAKIQASQADDYKAEKLDDKAKVLNRVFLARQEQEEEVKMVNRMIMDAKCHAVRDAQIHEKQLIAEELKKDDERLREIVNEHAREALNKEDEKGRKEQEKRAKYAKEIRKQLSERENMRFLEAERVEEEAKVARRAIELIKEEDERQRQLIFERKRKFRSELQNLKEISEVFKKMLCDQERLADMRIVAYQKEKHEKEQKLKNEQRVCKQESERRHQRLYTLAEKALNTKNKNDELAYLRERDRIEREYRAKEKAAAIKKRETERELLEARAIQAQDMKARLALQIAHAEEDFNVLMQNLNDEEEKQKKIDKERESRRCVYRRDIIQQMNDKEVERRRLLDLERARTSEWVENERQREANIKSVINAKIQDMRENCLPDKYIRDVEKQLNKIQAKQKIIFR